MAKVNGTLVAKLATGAAVLGYVAVLTLGGLRAGSPAQIRPARGATGEPVRQEREVRDNAAAYAALYRVAPRRESRDNAAAYEALAHTAPVRETRDNAAAYEALYSQGNHVAAATPVAPLPGGTSPACTFAPAAAAPGAGCGR